MLASLAHRRTKADPATAGSVLVPPGSGTDLEPFWVHATPPASQMGDPRGKSKRKSKRDFKGTYKEKSKVTSRGKSTGQHKRKSKGKSTRTSKGCLRVSEHLWGVYRGLMELSGKCLGASEACLDGVWMSLAGV